MVDQLLERTTQKRAQFQARFGDFVAELAGVEQPADTLFIGCSDSRVLPEGIFGLAPGQWFMHRNVGNIVPPYAQTELVFAAVLDFAIVNLQVTDIIVCGHTDCGALHALSLRPDLSLQPGLSRWLYLARPAYEKASKQTGSGDNAEGFHLALVERNVVHQVENLRSYPRVRNAEAEGRLQLHGWVYHLESSKVTGYDLETDSFV